MLNRNEREECDYITCNEIDGEHSEQRPTGCLVLSLLEDPTARAVMRGMLYPPILLTRVLKATPKGPKTQLPVPD